MQHMADLIKGENPLVLGGRHLRTLRKHLGAYPLIPIWHDVAVYLLVGAGLVPARRVGAAMPGLGTSSLPDCGCSIR